MNALGTATISKQKRRKKEKTHANIKTATRRCIRN
jgi:hypothetical protein